MFDEAKMLIETFRRKDPAAPSCAAVVFGRAGFTALMLHRAAAWCNLQGWEAFAGFVSGLNRFATGFDAAPDVKIGRNVYLPHASGVVMESGVVVGDDTVIGARVLLRAGAVVPAGTEVAPGAIVGPDETSGAEVQAESDTAPKAEVPSASIEDPAEEISALRARVEALEALVEAQRTEIERLSSRRSTRRREKSS